MEQDSKTCARCGESKCVSAFNRLSAAKDGLQSWCRICQAEYRRERYPEHRERDIQRAREWNVANADRVRGNARERYRRDPETKLKSWRKSKAKHGEKWSASASARRRENLEEYRERERKWRAVNAESVAERKRRYRKTNPNVVLQEKAKEGRRRAVVQSGAVTPEDIAQRIDYYGGLCWICGEPASVVDHVKPLVAGGPHSPANIRPACAACNHRKGGRWWGSAQLQELVAWVRLRLTD